MRFDGSLLLSAAFSAALLAAPAAALAEAPKRTVVNRVLAVVGDDPITQIEVTGRLVPHFRKLAAYPEKERAAAESQLRREMLQQIIEERLIEERASELRILVGMSEIDSALRHIAEQQKRQIPEVLSAVREQGMSEEAYRAELGRQLLRAKLMRLDVWSTVPKDAAGNIDESRIAAAEKAHMDKLAREASVEVMP